MFWSSALVVIFWYSQPYSLSVSPLAIYIFDSPASPLEFLSVLTTKTIVEVLQTLILHDCDRYSKLRQLLSNIATRVTICDNELLLHIVIVITNCDSRDRYYVYEMRRYPLCLLLLFMHISKNLSFAKYLKSKTQDRSPCTGQELLIMIELIEKFINYTNLYY